MYGHNPFTSATPEEAQPVLSEKRVDILKSYPWIVGISSILCFSGAIVRFCRLAFDPIVANLFGVWPLCAAIGPLILILVAFLINLTKCLPGRLAALIGIVGPSIVLFFGAYRLGIESLGMSAGFVSTDCVTFQRKYELSQSWKAASDFKAGCSGASTIQECPNYEGELAKNPDWNFLQYLETSTGCGGWCAPGKTLWVFPSGVRDPCSVVVGEALSARVFYPAIQLAIFNTAILFMSVVGISLLGPKLLAHGVAW
mmetsp:Transcript_13449/g.22146  ORF Transcript_13449/g.22146 Transcript_13449/m.22146 type:complete len:256 (+) Transcript_13449:79-846(+)